MPKSMKVSVQVRPAASGACGVTKMFPGCGSAWKKPAPNSCSNITSAKVCATSVGSIPAARSAATSFTLIAVTSDRVSTRRVVRSHTTVGPATRAPSANSSPNRSADTPSWR